MQDPNRETWEKENRFERTESGDRAGTCKEDQGGEELVFPTWCEGRRTQCQSGQG